MSPTSLDTPFRFLAPVSLAGASPLKRARAERTYRDKHHSAVSPPVIRFHLGLSWHHGYCASGGCPAKNCCGGPSDREHASWNRIRFYAGRRRAPDLYNSTTSLKGP